MPLLLAYEALLALASPGRDVPVRNAADMWLRMLLYAFQVNPLYVSPLLILGLLVFILILRRSEIPLVWGFFLLMLLEAIVYAILLGPLVNTMMDSARRFQLWSGLAGVAFLGGAEFIWSAPRLNLSLSFSPLAELALALGAGLFEELVFRVTLMTVLVSLSRTFFANWIAVSASALIAAALFSYAHHLGSLGDPFSLDLFLFRMFAGLIFALLYQLRGFAITAYAHAIYDVRVILFS